MTKRLLLALALLVPLVATAQTASQKQTIQRISDAAARMQTMQGDFTQTKHMKMLGDKMTSKGRMYYRQSDKLRWEYTSPYTYTFIMNGGKVLLRKGDRKDVVDVRQNKMFREIAQIILNSVVGKCLTNDKDFKVSLAEGKSSYTATLLPQRKNLKQMYQKIVLQFNRQTLMVEQVTMHERNGDYTEIDMRGMKRNAAVANSVFNID